ncbi:ribose transport system ATP-binding protein [Aequitasia blattaphilus]|uniref:ATP-binding cassette domain-containing protein n=1 Tax=Aequitasia blattaphilus TaxID=2949332 RepID=A0ABT1EEW2_9FIRM|nr:ATP-binding cassette domain-containing protein [Aequitasia blattaphilus]MCP1103371.1 ATP-binding cassette domain-containing protein [Aequitasia blattaphilus]MCR8616011.1 ATP-binding cassette domain-containing protein [Aequitasia blattaphilus]
MKQELLRIEHVSLNKSKIDYLRNLSMWIEKAEILGLISLNYHGLEELIDLIINNAPIQQGKVYYDGNSVNSYLGKVKKENKVCIIDRQSRLAPDLTVADNIFVLRKGFKKYFINSSILEKEVARTLTESQIEIEPNILAGLLTEGQRYQVELIKAVSFGAKLVIVQNVGELLSFNDLSKFHELMKCFAKQGVSFLYVSNDYREVFDISDRALLYKNGQIKKVLYKDEMHERTVLPYLQPIKDLRARENMERRSVLQVKDLYYDAANKVSFLIHQGECITILDKEKVLIHHSIMELMTLGIQKGNIFFNGDKFVEEVLLIPENPISSTLFLDQSYLYNLLFLIDKKIDRSVIPTKVIESVKKEWGKKIGRVMDCSSIRDLSIREKYQLIYYKAILYRPKLVIVMQPFAVADFNLREEIIKLVAELKQSNIAVLLLSSYAIDIKSVSDQYIVLGEESEIQ